MDYTTHPIGESAGKFNVSTGALLVDARSAVTLVGGPDVVTVDSTATGKTLATLLGKALSAALSKLTLIPATAGVYWASGSASAASAPLPIGGVEVAIGKTEADLLKFYAASSITMTVVQEG
jgi:hypothetical protein